MWITLIYMMHFNLFHIPWYHLTCFQCNITCIMNIFTLVKWHPCIILFFRDLFYSIINFCLHIYFNWLNIILYSLSFQETFFFFLAFDFCRFCVVIRFFHPRHKGQWPPTSKDFYTRSYPLHYFLILILEKEPVFFLFNVEC